MVPRLAGKGMLEKFLKEKVIMSRKMWLIVGVFIVLTLSGVIFVIGYNSNIFERDNNFNVIIRTDKDVIHRNEVFNLTIMDVPKNANISWKLGDGSSSFGLICTHYYELSNRYNITAIVNIDGDIFIGNSTIYAHNDNINMDNSGSGFRNVFPIIETQNRYNLVYFHYCGVGPPLVNIRGEILGLTGKMRITVYLVEHFDDSIQEVGIIREDHIGFQQNIPISYSRDDLLINPNKNPYSLELSIILYEGIFNSWNFNVEIIYP